MNLQLFGTVAACFGMTNCFLRPIGGVVSDEMRKRFGMRKRLWVVQIVAGLLCVLLGKNKNIS